VPAPQDLQAELDRIFLRQANAAIRVDGVDQNFVFNYANSSGVFSSGGRPSENSDWTNLKSAVPSKYPAILTDPGLLFAAYVKSLSEPRTFGISEMPDNSQEYGSVIRGDLEEDHTLNGYPPVLPLSLTNFSSNVTAHEIGHQLGLDLWNRNLRYHSERGTEFLMTPRLDGRTQPCRLDEKEWNQVNP